VASTSLLGKPFAGHRFLLGAATLSAGRGGIARVARMTAHALSDLGASIVPLSYLDRHPLEVAGVPVTCASGGKLRFAASNMLMAAGCHDFIYDSAGIARAYPRMFAGRRGYIVWMHGIEAWEKLRPEHRVVLRRARLVLVNSQYTLDRFQALHGALPQARMCWLATEEDDQVPARSARSEPPTVLTLSRLDVADAYKGHRELIAAWPRVQAAVPEARLIIAGDGNAVPALKAQVCKLGIDGAVEFLGFVPEGNLPQLWERADIFAMPSRKEGFGLVYVEAMRHGLPVIASTHDAGTEVNVDGETGFNVDLNRDAMLAARLIELLSDATLRHRLGKAGARRWKAHFSFSGFRTRLCDILRSELG